MTSEKEILTRRVDELLLKLTSPRDDDMVTAYEAYQGALGLALSVYGENSPQSRLLTDAEAHARQKAEKEGHRQLTNYMGPLQRVTRGWLANLKSELEEGLTGSVRRRVSAEVLGDLVELSKMVIQEAGDGARNVAAVVIAAAFEDTIRRMGTLLAGIGGRPKLSKVIDALGAKNVLVGPELQIARSYLKFRNDALHADWDAIDLPSIHSVQGFVEQLLLRHF